MGNTNVDYVSMFLPFAVVSVKTFGPYNFIKNDMNQPCYISFGGNVLVHNEFVYCLATMCAAVVCL